MHSWRNQSPTTSEPRAVDNLSTFHGESLLQVRATANDGVLARQFRRSGDYFVACNEDSLSHFGILCNRPVASMGAIGNARDACHGQHSDSFRSTEPPTAHTISGFKNEKV